MKKVPYLQTLFLIFIFTAACSPRKDVLTIELQNPGAFDIKEHTISLDIPAFGSGAYYLYQNGKPLPAQIVPPSGADSVYRIYFQTDIPANGMVTLNLRSGSAKTDTIAFATKKTLAELWYKEGGYFEGSEYKGGEFKPHQSLRVPDECTDHSYYIKYEGPGWESDKVGYRLYLDWRNAIDIYGKKTTAIVLPGVGLDGYESYHNMSDWGMDVLKVGPSLGLGSLGYWNGQAAERVAETDSVYCKVTEDGNLRSEILINYYGWKIADKSLDLQSSLSILAGSRATHHVVTLNNDIANLCTGIVRLENTTFFTGDSASEWNYIATWGKQSLADDSLGMAVIFKQRSLKETTMDDNSHVVVLNPEGHKVDYYFLAAWEQEPDGIKTLNEFQKYLKNFTALLNEPVIISYKSGL